MRGILRVIWEIAAGASFLFVIIGGVIILQSLWTREPPVAVGMAVAAFILVKHRSDQKRREFSKTAWQVLAARSMIRVFDKGTESLDRYTIVVVDPREGMNFDAVEHWTYNALVVSDMKFPSPPGYLRAEVVRKGEHLGKEIPFEDLPRPVSDRVRDHFQMETHLWCPACGCLDEQIDRRWADRNRDFFNNTERLDRFLEKCHPEFAEEKKGY